MLVFIIFYLFFIISILLSWLVCSRLHQKVTFLKVLAISAFGLLFCSPIIIKLIEVLNEKF